MVIPLINLFTGRLTTIQMNPPDIAEMRRTATNEYIKSWFLLSLRCRSTWASDIFTSRTPRMVFDWGWA
jgi:hypothetical protein